MCKKDFDYPYCQAVQASLKPAGYMGKLWKDWWNGTKPEEFYFHNVYLFATVHAQTKSTYTECSPLPMPLSTEASFVSRESTSGMNKGNSIFWCIVTTASATALMSTNVRFFIEECFKRSSSPSWSAKRHHIPFGIEWQTFPKCFSVCFPKVASRFTQSYTGISSNMIRANGRIGL